MGSSASHSANPTQTISLPRSVCCLSPDWIDVRLMKATGGRILAKTGADGLLCLSLIGRNRGLAIKVLDGGTRALGPATVEILRRIGWLSDDEPQTLLNIAEPPLLDSTGTVVGSIRVSS